jgi:hypothetical protein
MARKTLKDEPAPSIKTYIERAAKKAGSGNKAAAALRMSQGNFSRLMAYGAPGDDLLIRLAEYLGEDPEKLLLLARSEYASEKARPLWSQLLKRYIPPAAAALLVMVLAATSGADPLPSSWGACLIRASECNVYYVKLWLVLFLSLIFSPAPADMRCSRHDVGRKHVPC